MTHARIPDFSVPMPARPVTMAVEHQPIAAPIGRFPGSAAALTILVEDEGPARSRRTLAVAGDVLAALVLIVGGAVLIGCATLL